MEIQALRAFEDNYIWLLKAEGSVVAVDPGDADPLLRYLRETHAHLAAILITHHHGDHTGGIKELVSHHNAPVFGPTNEEIDGVTQLLHEGDRVEVPGVPRDLTVLDVPGHTRGHIAYFAENILFSGDTLFACGCGRLFEGTADQMWRSLNKISALPAQTQVFCAHEYTQSNIRFALAVEPGNQYLQQRAQQVARLRKHLAPTVPFTLADELETNPFLRTHKAEVIASAERFCGKTLSGPAEVFAALREWKNVFR